ncbi:MAG: LysR family transcriptional regulator [Pseudomonadota bacterium]
MGKTAAGGERPGKVDLTMVATLKALFDTGRVSRAADALGVTQRSVSQNLRRLRDYFGDELFVRTGNSLHPTPRAIALAPAVARLMRDIDLISRAPGAFDPATANREFIICMSEIGEFILLPRLAAAFAREAPMCAIRGLRVAQPQLTQALEKGDVDLAAGTLIGADSSLRQQRLAETPIVCMASSNGRWARVPLSREDYAEGRHVAVQRITDSIDPVGEHLRIAGIHRNVALSVSNDFVAARAVAEADLICTASRHVGVQLAALFPIQIQPLPFEAGKLVTRMLWHERFQQDPGHVWLRSMVEKTYRQALG